MPEILRAHNIGLIFKQHNIIEYKSPEDYVSINDYYKVLAYTCIYQSDTEQVCEIRPEELTMTFACSHFPEKLVNHLKEFQDIEVEQAFPGGYYLTGGIFPTQILVTGQLSGQDNFWLSRLRKDLEIEEDLAPLSEAYKGKQKDPRYEAVMDVLLRANHKKAEEAKGMCEAIKELFADEYKEAETKGGEKAEERYSQLILRLTEAGRQDDIVRAASDAKVLQQLYGEFGI